MARKQKVATATEQYAVKLNYRQDDGFWKMGHVERVDVPVPAGSSGKDLHEAAGKLVAPRFKECEVVSVTYC